jgi:UV DNA damage endonuclease
MKVGIPKYEISYLGPPVELEEASDFNGDHMAEFISSICSNIEFNKSKGFKVTAIDLASFEFIGEIFSSGDLIINTKLVELIRSVNVDGHRLFLYVSKDYFLGSSVNSIVDSTKICLNLLSEILDFYKCESGIIIRVGSAYGNRKKTISRFYDNFKTLNPDTIKKIMVTNDDRPSLFSVKDLLSEISLSYGVPIVFRTLSHYFNPGLLSYGDALGLSLSTWNRNSLPIIIHSEPQESNFDGAPDTRNISDFIKYRIPTFNNNICVILDSNYKEYSCYKYGMEYNSLKPVIINRKKK